MQRSKAYKASAAKIDADKLYSPLEAIKLAKTTPTTKFDATVDVAMRLGVDPRKADQMVRGTVNLPHGTGKTARVLVFANGDKAEEARAAGADFVGSDDMIEKVTGGWLDFDAVVATLDMMGKVGRLGRVLGPRGLMPNPKTGTVTPDVTKAVTDIKGGKIEFRVDRHANLHFIIGKSSFAPEKLAENYAAALDEVLRLKPSSSKGRYLRKVTVSTTMGPGIPVDPNRTRNLLVEDDEGLTFPPMQIAAGFRAVRPYLIGFVPGYGVGGIAYAIDAVSVWFGVLVMVLVSLTAGWLVETFETVVTNEQARLTLNWIAIAGLALIVLVVLRALFASSGLSPSEVIWRIR